MNFVKNETLKMWISRKMRFPNCEFLDKLRIFVPVCQVLELGKRVKLLSKSPLETFNVPAGSYLSCLIKGAKKVYLSKDLFSPTPSSSVRLEVTQTITRKIGNFCLRCFKTTPKWTSRKKAVVWMRVEFRMSRAGDDKQTQTDSQVPHIIFYCCTLYV